MDTGLRLTFERSAFLMSDIFRQCGMLILKEVHEIQSSMKEMLKENWQRTCFGNLVIREIVLSYSLAVERRRRPMGCKGTAIV